MKQFDVCEEDEIFAKEFRAELSALSAASNQDEVNDRVFKKCSHVCKYTSKKCNCVNGGEIMLFQLSGEQTILVKIAILLRYLFICLLV